MRLALRGDTWVESLALRLGLVPRPAAEAWGGVALTAVLHTAVELGVVARLARSPATAAELARDLALDPQGTELLVACLASAASNSAFA